MDMEKMTLPEVILLTPRIFDDSRGWFFESYNKRAMAEVGLVMEFIQDNHSLSVPKHTLRGIHFQNNPTAQSKLVRCVRGRILDYAVDLRKGSESYLQWVCVELSAENKKQLFIPKGFGHAFVTLEDNCEVNYKVDNIYSRPDERTVRYDDPEIGITWPEGMIPVLSERDRDAPLLSDCDCNFML